MKVYSYFYPGKGQDYSVIPPEKNFDYLTKEQDGLTWKEITTLEVLELPCFSVVDHSCEPWRGKIVSSWLDDMPPGWLPFLKELEKDIDLILATHPGSYFLVEQMKEKWGGLRLYHSSSPDIAKQVEKLIEKAENDSEEFCYDCGQPAVYETNGWVTFVCKDCAEKLLKKRQESGNYTKEITLEDIVKPYTFSPAYWVPVGSSFKGKTTPNGGFELTF
jgi:hypothetical protein